MFVDIIVEISKKKGNIHTLCIYKNPVGKSTLWGYIII